MTYITTKDFKLEVAKGNVPNNSTFEKFGKNPDVDTVSSPEDIWNGGGDYTGQPTGSAETLEIFSSDANDTIAGTGARTVRISNLLDGTGAQAADVVVNMNGVTAVSLGAGTYNRSSRMKVLTAGSGGENAGELTLRHTTTTTNIFAVMPAAFNQTEIAAYTVPLGFTLYVERISFELVRANGTAGSATVSFRCRPDGGVYDTVVSPAISTAFAYVFANNGYYKFNALDDLKCRVDDVSDNNSIITAEFGGVLIAD